MAATASKEDLKRWLDKCETLKKAGHSEAAIAYAMGYNDVISYRAFRAMVEQSLKNAEEE